MERGENALKEKISPLFHNIFNKSLTSVDKLHNHLLIVVVRFIFSSMLQIWYFEVWIFRSISESPLDFEITRVDWMSNYYFPKFAEQVAFKKRAMKLSLRRLVMPLFWFVKIVSFLFLRHSFHFQTPILFLCSRVVVYCLIVAKLILFFWVVRLRCGCVCVCVGGGGGVVRGVVRAPCPFCSINNDETQNANCHPFIPIRFDVIFEFPVVKCIRAVWI